MPSRELFVGNLPYATTESELRELFEKSGCRVASVRLVTDFDSGRPKGYAFVEVEWSAEAERVARQLDGSELQGRRITVNQARRKQPGGRAAGGGGRSPEGGRGRRSGPGRA